MKIAAFDSGIGGLTAIAPLLKNYPSLQVTYFGDLANLPYGTKSETRIRELTQYNLEWLIEYSKTGANPKSYDLLVVACNTASARAMDVALEVGALNKIPVVGVIEPGCKAALATKSPRVVVLGTQSTIASNSYIRGLETVGTLSRPIVQKACPLFVPLVEDGLVAGPAVEWIIRNYLDSVLQPKDAVVLGCTHYPYLLSTLEKLYPDQTWIDAGGSLLLDETVSRLLEREKNAAAVAGQLDVMVSDQTLSPEQLRKWLRVLGLETFAHTLHTVKPA